MVNGFLFVLAGEHGIKKQECDSNVFGEDCMLDGVREEMLITSRAVSSNERLHT